MTNQEINELHKIIFEAFYKKYQEYNAVSLELEHSELERQRVTVKAQLQALMTIRRAREIKEIK